MLKRDKMFYGILLMIMILQIFSDDLADKLPVEAFEVLFIYIGLYKVIKNRMGKINVFLGISVTRRELYILTIIFDCLNSILISILMTLNKIRVNNAHKNWIIYVFIFYFVYMLVLFSTLSFNQIFKHTDYEAITWITWIIFVAAHSGIYSTAFNTDNFISFNEKLAAYKNFTLRQFYIMLIITIAFNYITSYLVHKGIEIKIKGEVE